MKQGLNQQQQQTLRLNPRLARFGRILEMSVPEFEEEISRALADNPALEAVDPEYIPTAVDDEGHAFSETAEQMQRADYASDDDVPWYRTHTPAGDSSGGMRENLIADTTQTGASSLENQLSDYELTPSERLAAQYVIGNLDSNGYLTRPPQAIADDIAMSAGIDISVGDVEDAIELIKGLDPAGIAAKDLRECLLLQVGRLKGSTAARAYRILDEFFDDFANRRFDKVVAKSGYNEDQLKEVQNLIRTLNPKPGSALEGVGSEDKMRQITPDFLIDTAEGGKITVALAGSLPHLGIEATFSVDHADAASAAFVKQRREEASEFIDMAKRRANTLMAIMTAIVSLQPRFFHTLDMADLRPMVLRDIAAITGFDLSVISRATSGKYALTPLGMVALKSLFRESVDDEGLLSAQNVENTIRTLIAGEDKHHPLSDEAICQALKSQGQDVARRTIAKYRERLGIPVARLRRE